MCACHGKYMCRYHRQRRFEESGSTPTEAYQLAWEAEINHDWKNDPYPYKDLETKRAMEAATA